MCTHTNNDMLVATVATELIIFLLAVPDDVEDLELTSGAIVGIVISVCVAVGVIGICVIILWRKKYKLRSQ